MTGRARIFLIVIAFLAGALLTIPGEALAQDANKKTDENKEPRGSITGRVTKDGNPVAGAVVVLLVGTSHGSQDEGALARVRTDQDGRYHIADIPSGNYRVRVLLPAYVDVDLGAGGDGSVRVPSEGDVSGVDFSLVRGGVITGHVTDQSGAPLQRQSVNLYSIDEQGPRRMLHQLIGADTDDRGIYRIYGLSPGIYIVSVGMDPKQSGQRFGSEGFYREVFWPGVGEESKARRVKVASGSEEAGVDITVGPLLKAHCASGRIINAESQSPMPNQRYGLAEVDERSSGFSSGDSTDGAGRFRMEGLGPGRYSVSAVLEVESGLYSDSEAFEISNDDVNGLEVRVHRGATISGSVVLESGEDSGLLARLSEAQLIASLWPVDPLVEYSATRVARINPDGSFRFIGLHPGKFSIGLVGNKQAKVFSLKSIQGRGVQDAPAGQSGPGQLIEVGEAEALTGIQVVLSPSNGLVRGQIRVEGGELPRGAQINVSIGRETGSLSHGPIEVDGNGRFVIDGLEPGDYRVYVWAYPKVPVPGHGYGPLASTTQAVTVSSGSEATVVLVLDLSEKEKKNQ